MKIIRAMLANSRVDAHGEIMGLGVLEAMRNQVKTQYIPMGVEHDPREPPVGRVIDAEISEVEEGIFALNGVCQLFESGDRIPFDSTREIPVRQYPVGKLEIAYDRSYRGEDDQSAINEIAGLFGTETREEIKKSVDPITVLTIAGGFALVAIARGFLQKVGADGWEVLKNRLKKLTVEKPGEQQERLLVFEFTVRSGEEQVNTRTILTNPTSEELDLFLHEGLAALDSRVAEYMCDQVRPKVIVHEYKDGQLQTKFGIRSDGVPVRPVAGSRAREGFEEH